MKYFESVVLAAPEVFRAGGVDLSKRRRGFRSGQRFVREVLTDVRDYHPFTGRVPRHAAEVAEEIGARLTVLAVRTHVPVRGQPVPPVTLRMRHALRVLARSGGQLTVSGLGSRIGIGLPGSSQLSTRMLRRGLVSKVRRRDGGPHPDGRVCTVVLTRVGWRHVPRDEPAQREESWMRFGPVASDYRNPDRTWPKGVRRVSQPPSAIEQGLACSVLRAGALLAGLRAVQATMYGFDYLAWETEVQSAVMARRRHQRDRLGERYGLAWLPPPEYVVRPARGARRRGRSASQEALRQATTRSLDELLLG